MSRRFYVKEKVSVEGLVEGFNIFNRTQITGINTTIYALNGTTRVLSLPVPNAFGTVTEAGGTLYRERQIQIGFRVKF